MAAAWPTSLRNLPRKPAEAIHSAVSLFVLFILDFLDAILCIFFRFMDEFIEGRRVLVTARTGEVGRGEKNEVSETLYGRKNVFTELGFPGFLKKLDDLERTQDGLLVKNRWSDCGCESRVSWMCGTKASCFCERILQRLFAVDLLGFGRSPRPRSCLYTLKDHLEMIEKSALQSASFFSCGRTLYGLRYCIRISC